ncbi:unnamed protein product [Durusdinium trenchii]|uniref:Transmembrane protein n=1 Tax=Durusdinium trenchii TaxID=1381693 RepID=A0ABP0JE64_9DINO
MEGLDGGADGSASSQAAQRTEEPINFGLCETFVWFFLCTFIFTTIVIHVCQDAQSQRVESELLDDGEALAQFHAKAKARRKNRQKRVQYQFLFKAGAFVIMLAVVMITKKIQQWYKPAADNAAPAEAKTTKPNLASHDGLDSEL